MDLKVVEEAQKIIRTITVDDMSDTHPGKDAQAPAVSPAFVKTNPDGAPADGSTIFRISVFPGTAQTVNVNFTVYYDPSKTALDAWQA